MSNITTKIKENKTLITCVGVWMILIPFVILVTIKSIFNISFFAEIALLASVVIFQFATSLYVVRFVPELKAERMRNDKDCKGVFDFKYDERMWGDK